MSGWLWQWKTNYRNWFSKERITNNDNFYFKSPITKPSHFRFMAFTLQNRSKAARIGTFEVCVPAQACHYHYAGSGQSLVFCGECVVSVKSLVAIWCYACWLSKVNKYPCNSVYRLLTRFTIYTFVQSDLYAHLYFHMREMSQCFIKSFLYS